MQPPWMLAVPIGAMLAAGVPARAQVPSYGQPASPDEPPGFDQQGGGVGAGNQPPVLDLAGTWSGEMAGVGEMAGSLREIYQFASNGHFVAVVEGMNGGLVLRIWGSYLTSRVGPNQIRIQSQTDSWAPQQLCRRPAGGTPKCQPLDMPRQAVAVATFVAADTIEIGNGAVGAEAITQHRVAGATPLSGNTPALFVLPGEDSAPERPQLALPPIPLLR